MSVQLYTINKYSKPYFSELHMHLLFWGIPILLELLPLFVGESYGMDDYYPADAVFTCFIRDGISNSGSLVVFIVVNTIYVPLSLLILSVLYIF